MRSKAVILVGLNILFWGIFVVYNHFYKISDFISGVVITFSISTLIGFVASLQVVFTSLFLAWGLYLLAYFEGCNSEFLAGCATALTVGVVTSFIITRPL